jgi:hypothetical protein
MNFIKLKLQKLNKYDNYVNLKSNYIKHFISFVVYTKKNNPPTLQTINKCNKNVF